MWADQISTSGDSPASVSGQSLGKEAVTGYLDDQHDQAPSVAETKTQDVDDTAAPQDRAASVIVDSPESASIAPAESEQAPPVPFKESPLAFPSAPQDPEPTESTPAAPLTFPTSDDSASRPQSVKLTSQPGGVTFGETVNSPPSRGETPVPGAEQKRKRISSQNLQKFARKMSLATRRAGSTTSTPRESQDAGTSTPDDVPSATVSMDDAGQKDKRKEKKEKRRTLF